MVSIIIFSGVFQIFTAAAYYLHSFCSQNGLSKADFLQQRWQLQLFIVVPSHYIDYGRGYNTFTFQGKAFLSYYPIILLQYSWFPNTATFINGKLDYKVGSLSDITSTGAFEHALFDIWYNLIASKL